MPTICPLQKRKKAKKLVKFQKSVCDKWLNYASLRKGSQRLKMERNALQNRMSRVQVLLPLPRIQTALLNALRFFYFFRNKSSELLSCNSRSIICVGDTISLGAFFIAIACSGVTSTPLCLSSSCISLAGFFAASDKPVSSCMVLTLSSELSMLVWQSRQSVETPKNIAIFLKSKMSGTVFPSFHCPTD